MYNGDDMTTFEKAFWVTNGESISFQVPISKVDQSKRIVSGWATTDVIDKQNDIVNAEASARAFDKFRGNVREQHTPLAVGKVISFRKDKYFDKESKTFYDGVYVDVYVSKGAEDTWHKVTEGILTGFSIGGNIKDSEQVYNKDIGATVRIIKDYELYELSLVDNPANQTSNVVSIQKFSNKDSEDSIEKNYLENVFWCADSGNIILSQEESYVSPQSNKSMVNIGFVESKDINKSQTIEDLVNDFEKVSGGEPELVAIDNVAKSIAEENEKEGNNVGILNKKNANTTEEAIVKSDEVVEEVTDASADEAVEEVFEKTAEEEVADEDVVKNLEEVAEAAEEEIEKSTTPAESNEDLAKAVDEIKVSVVGAVEELSVAIKNIADQIANMTKSISGVSQELSVVKGSIEEFGQRVDVIENDTAVRKSGDLGGIVQEEKTEKSMWGGRFLNSADLYR